VQEVVNFAGADPGADPGVDPGLRRVSTSLLVRPFQDRVIDRTLVVADLEDVANSHPTEDEGAGLAVTLTLRSDALKQFFSGESGQDLIEYALITALIG